MEITGDPISCDTEPIHLINDLQDFGLLIILSLADEKIIACGDNSFEYLGINSDELLEKNPGVIFVNFSSIKLDIEDVLVNRKHLEYKIHFIYKNQSLFATFRRSEDLFLCEIESDEQLSILDNTNKFFIQVNELKGKHSLEELYYLCVRQIQEITNFDRVLLYKFKEDSSGEVIAESRNESLDSILGFHFPSTDIPLPARAMYLKNPIRIIKSKQRKIITLKKSKSYQNHMFDLGSSSFRAPHSHHLEYLSNMGIVTSMSISLEMGDTLWGLFICHSVKENIPSLTARNFLAIFSKIIFRQITQLNVHNDSILEIKLQSLFINLIKKINSVSIDKVLEVFKSESNLLMNEFEADGFYIQLRNEVFELGSLPDRNTINKISKLLAEKFSDRPFFTDDLKKSFPEEFRDIEKSNGVLSIPVSSLSTDRIIWFREEVIRKIVWAGNKEEAFFVKDNRISPRQSFSRWIETIKGKSIPWSELHIKIVKDIFGIVEIIDKKILEEKLAKTLEQVRKSEAELEELNATKDKFFSILSHNLRSPFSGLLGISELLIELVQDEKNPSKDEIQNYAELIHASSTKAFDLSKNLFEWGKIKTGKIEIEKKEIELNSILDEIIYNISHKLKNQEIELIIESEKLITIHTDGNALKTVISNLLLNAIKYSNKNQKVYLRLLKSKDSIQIEIEDFGIGMTDLELKKIFKIEEYFARPGTNGESGTGLGLIIVKEYLDKLNFKIEIMSQQNVGTKVVLILT